MIFNCQKEPIEELQKLADAKRQSIIIEGASGSGKTYLSHQYANMLQIDDYSSVLPKVADIRDALDSMTELATPVVLCVENLDTGVAAASYTLLKTLEEPQPNLYLVITVRNIKMVPDTIISRSAVISTSVPRLEDIDEFGKFTNLPRYEVIKDRLAWRCARSFSDASQVLAMTNDQINYYESLSQVCQFKDNVSNIIWTLGHYQDNQPCNVELAIRAVMELMHNNFITKCGIDCIRELSANRIAQHAVLAKFVFNAKYCE